MRVCDAGKEVERRKCHFVIDVKGFRIKVAVREASVQYRNEATPVIFGALEMAPQVKKSGRKADTEAGGRAHGFRARP